jgi:hypothetical protein
MTLEQCVWNAIMNDPKSTTRETALETIDTHPLKKCYLCNGEAEDCAGYRPVSRYTEKKE